MKTEYVPRVNQLDSIALDDDISNIVREQLTVALQSLSPGLLSRFQPELDLCVRSALWFSSVCQQRATFGQQLLFICYDPDKLCRSRLALHYVLTVAARYAGDVVTFRGGGSDREWLQRTMQYAENASVVANFVNFFRFLGSGRRPSLVDVVLGLDHITMHGNRRRDVGYSSMTRELIWDGFMELLGFTLPLINYHSVKRKLRNMVSLGVAASKTDGNEMQMQRPEMTLATKCAYCTERPTLPYHMQCSHVFCYLCLQGNILADSKFQCPICDGHLSIVEPVP